MTYGYSVTEQGMSQQIYETHVELRGDLPPKRASLILAKQIESARSIFCYLAYRQERCEVLARA
jgi:hypothetical protein